MGVKRNVGNKYIDGAVHMDLNHWKRIINTVSSTSFQTIIRYFFHYLAFVSVSYYGGSILGISHFLTYRNSSEMQSGF